MRRAPKARLFSSLCAVFDSARQDSPPASRRSSARPPTASRCVSLASVRQTGSLPCSTEEDLIVARHDSRSLAARIGLNLAWGGGIGAVVGLIFCTIATVQRIARGPQFIESYGIGFGTLLLSYEAGCVAAGLLVGAARPLLRWRLGAIVVGMLAGTVAAGALGLGISGPIVGWGADAWTAVLVMGLLGGGWVGNSSWEKYVEPTLPGPELPPGPPPPPPPLGLWRPR